MPWKPTSLIQARMRFVKLVLKARNAFAQTCQIFQISRKTGYKWKHRFLDQGGRGLRNQSRRPKDSPQRTTRRWLRAIRSLRRRHRRWGAKKIHQQLRRKFPRRKIPAIRTITRWLQHWKLTRRRRRVRSPQGPQVCRPALTVPVRSNQVWTVDFKGWFRTGDGQRVEPLTVRDLFSRYVLAIRLLPDQRWWRVRAVFLRLFDRYGRPKAIRVDNGFGSKGPAGLSRLSAWWTALGIRVQFIEPGHPEQNGSHEQMHREFKADLTVPASTTPRAQQRRSDRWVRYYNQVRPHEALKQRTPAERYRRGRAQPVPKLCALDYPGNWEVRSVRSNGQIRWRGRLRFVGEAFVGTKLGLKPTGPGTWMVYFGKMLLGELRALDACGLRPAAYERQRPNQKPKV